MPPRNHRGYRKFFTRPRKGRRGWKSSGEKIQSEVLDLEVQDVTQGFLGFSESPSCAYHSPDSITNLLHNPIRVLSLYDGIGTGLYVLDKIGLKVEAYFSYEIDKDAIKVQRLNFSRRIQEMGCVTQLTSDAMASLGRIDLLIGGSPCSDLSRVNFRRKGFQDPQSTAHLFFYYARAVDYFTKAAKVRGTTFLWLFENTASMEAENKQIISRSLGCEPVKRCASYYVPMRRERLFWGNIPLMDLPPTRSLTIRPLQAFLKPYRIAQVLSVPTLTSTTHSQLSGKEKIHPVIEDGQEVLLDITEIELLFGFHEHFTDASLNLGVRRKLLGKAWSVNVVQALLKPLILLFQNHSVSNYDPNLD